jgi:peptide deformylase
VHVNNYLTYIKNVGDICYLRTPLLGVNMRLFGVNAAYRELVRACCSYLRAVALTDLEGYGRPYGISGANLGIPFNIIGVVHHRGLSSATCEVLINPEILEYTGPLEYASSNCGSLRLPESIEVLRYANVRVRYYNEAGTLLESTFGRDGGSYTIQHEVDHNLGILITDQGRTIPDDNKAPQISKNASASGLGA